MDIRYLPKVSRFDFEQHIFDTWNITKDLDVLLEYLCDTPTEEINTDKVLNIVLGMKQLGDLRFTKMLDMFENLVHYQEI